MLIDIKNLLKLTNMHVVELGGTKRPPFPYIAYTVDTQISGGDNFLSIIQRNVTAEVYTLKGSDIALSEVLVSNNIPFSVDSVYLDSDRIHATTYDFSLYEKLR